MLTGEIVEVDDGAKNFVIDIDPLGSHEKYIIYINKKTKFSILTYIYQSNADESAAGLDSDEEVNVSMQYSPADFKAVTKSSHAEVYLSNWIDGGKRGQQLIAESVNITTE